MELSPLHKGTVDDWGYLFLSFCGPHLPGCITEWVLLAEVHRCHRTPRADPQRRREAASSEEGCVQDLRYKDYVNSHYHVKAY